MAECFVGMPGSGVNVIYGEASIESYSGATTTVDLGATPKALIFSMSNYGGALTGVVGDTSYMLWGTNSVLISATLTENGFSLRRSGVDATTRVRYLAIM